MKVEAHCPGRTLVQVIDDGYGMDEKDAKMCFLRHATSKISNAWTTSCAMYCNNCF